VGFGQTTPERFDFLRGYSYALLLQTDPRFSGRCFYTGDTLAGFALFATDMRGSALHSDTELLSIIKCAANERMLEYDN
jgi:hypothetical protein